MPIIYEFLWLLQVFLCANCFVLPILFTSGFFEFLAQVLFNFCNCFDNIDICFFVTNICYKSPLIFMTKYYALIRGLFIKPWDASVCWDIVSGMLEPSMVMNTWHKHFVDCFFGKDFYISTNLMLGFPCIESFQIKVGKAVWSVVYLSIIYWFAKTKVSEDIL